MLHMSSIVIMTFTIACMVMSAWLQDLLASLHHKTCPNNALPNCCHVNVNLAGRASLVPRPPPLPPVFDRLQYQACQVSRIARVTHAIGSFHTLTRKPGLLSRIFVHAWNRDMASSFTSIRDRRIKMPRVLGYYLLYNGSSTAR